MTLAVPDNEPTHIEEGAYRAGVTAGFRAAYKAVLESNPYRPLASIVEAAALWDVDEQEVTRP